LIGFCNKLRIFDVFLRAALTGLELPSPLGGACVWWTGRPGALCSPLKIDPLSPIYKGGGVNLLSFNKRLILISPCAKPSAPPIFIGEERQFLIVLIRFFLESKKVAIGILSRSGIEFPLSGPPLDILGWTCEGDVAEVPFFTFEMDIPSEIYWGAFLALDHEA